MSDDKKALWYDALHQGRKPDGGARLHEEAIRQWEMAHAGQSTRADKPTYEQYAAALEQAQAEIGEVQLDPNLPDFVRKQF